MAKKTGNSSTGECTSLFDLIQQNSQIRNDKITPPSFGCLADLTAHHLKISEDSATDTNSKKFGSTNNGFFIPKLSLKFENKFSFEKCQASEVTKLKIEEDKSLSNKQSIISSNNSIGPKVESNPLDRRINDIKKECNLLALRKRDFKIGQKPVSLFGKVLCKKWSQRNITLVKNQKLLDNVTDIVKFDFSTPSPDAQILARMKKCITSS